MRGESHLKSACDKLFIDRITQRPANDTPALKLDKCGEISPALCGVKISDITHPSGFGGAYIKLTCEVILSSRALMARVCCFDFTRLAQRAEPKSSHALRDRVFTDLSALSFEVLSQPW